MYISSNLQVDSKSKRLNVWSEKYYATGFQQCFVECPHLTLMVMDDANKSNQYSHLKGISVYYIFIF